MLKYDFAIQTRSGLKVNSVVIAGHDQADAERKLFQMYRQCTILQCTEKLPDGRSRPSAINPASMEDIITMIAK